MLAMLGFLTVIIILVLIMTKKLSIILALILVPTIFALIGGSGLKVGNYILIIFLVELKVLHLRQLCLFLLFFSSE